MRIDTWCEYFKAELGINLRVLGLNVDGVDNHFSTQESVFEMQVNGMTQRQAWRRAIERFAKSAGYEIVE
jgi:hypothetical protein